MTMTLEQLHERAVRAEAERDAYCVWVHEGGHELVAERLGLEPDLRVVSPDEGVCVHRPGNSLENAAVSIAGVMAEALLNVPYKNRALPRTKLTRTTVFKWISELR